MLISRVGPRSLPEISQEDGKKGKIQFQNPDQNTFPVAPLPVQFPATKEARRADQRGVLELHLAKKAGAPITTVELDTSTPQRKVLSEALALYRRSFPNPDEREECSLIRARLHDMKKRTKDPELDARYGDSFFHALAGKSEGRVAYYSQFSTLPIGDDKGPVVVYGQYTAVEKDFRRRGMMGSLYPLRHEIAKADALSRGRTGEVLGTIAESEFGGQADTKEGIAQTFERLAVYERIGAKAIIIETDDGRWISPHVQPALSLEQDPIELLMMFRPLVIDEAARGKTGEMTIERARELLDAFVHNFAVEGFDKAAVDHAREQIAARFAQAKRVLLVPPTQLPDHAAFEGMKQAA